MSIREKIRLRTFEVVEINGLGKVSVLALKTSEMLDLSEQKDEKRSGLELVAKTIHDEAGVLVFASADEVAECSWPIVDQLVRVANKANGFAEKLDAAGKN